MATIGQPLTAPESGWRRYDDIDSRINYLGTLSWTVNSSDTNWYNNSVHSIIETSDDTEIKFKFYGTKLRIIQSINTTTMNNVINVSIDGSLIGNFSNNSTIGLEKMILLFEKTDLDLKEHIVNIKLDSSSIDRNIWWDAIDIDDTGYLLHPSLNQVSDISLMQIGDCIPCRYTVTTSGSAGYFSELGTCIANEIPVTGTTTPNGLFYLIKTKKGTLVADRVIQTSISWDTLNNTKFIEGGLQRSYTPYLITASAYYSTQYVPKNAFDNNYTTSWYCNNNALPTEGYHWLCTQFDHQIIINCIEISCIGGPSNAISVKNFIIQGSNDNTNWDSLYTGINIKYDNTFSKFTFNNSTPYMYYRIVILDSYYESNPKTYCGITQFNLININDLGLLNIRSLSGGCAYTDSNGDASVSNQNLGAWPTNNEWDTYIINSTLNNTITAGDDNIWHFNNIWNIMRSLPIMGLQDATGTVQSSLANNRILRGNGYSVSSPKNNLEYTRSSSVMTNSGFRPVLNYIESDITSEVIY